MHQQPPKTPLLNSTSAAKASHVDSSRAFTVYADISTMRSFAHPEVALAVDNCAGTGSPMLRTHPMRC